MQPDPTPGKKRLKIAMVIDCYDDSKNGAAISTSRFVDLLRKDHDISIITTGNPAPGKIILPRFYPPVVRKVMKRMHTPLAIPSDRKLRQVLRGMDIVHIQFPFFLGIQSVRIARKLKIPVISTFHIQAEHLAMNAGIRSQAFIRYCYRVWMKRIYNRSAIVICPSRFAEDELKHYGLTTPSTIISNGILPMFRPELKERPPEMAGKFIVLSAGRFAPEKNQEIIIEAVRMSKYAERIQLILIGEGLMKERLVGKSKELPNQTLFLTLSQEEMVRYYNMADLYIHAATVEVECMTVLEAMGCGVPVLIADSPKSATKQFALDDRSLFPSNDIRKLAEKIDYWIEHPADLALAGRQYHDYSVRFRIENSCAKLIGIYKQVTGESIP